VVVAPPRPEPVRHVGPASIAPPLPLPIPGESSGHVDDRVAPATPAVTDLLRPGVRRRMLRAGCYLLRYTPTPRATALVPLHYDGTMRVERDSNGTTASGDLYLHRRNFLAHPAAREPDPSAGIPIFPRRNYRYYLRVTQILEMPTFLDRFTLGFELHRFDAATVSWQLEGPFTAEMRWTSAPVGYPSRADFLHGDVLDASGSAVGELAMGWVSKRLRRAVIEIDRVASSESALSSSAGVDWAEIFAQVGWEVTVDESDSNLSEPSGDAWSDAEMHAELLARRDSADLDSEWRYWLLCVRRLDSTERGIMFDAFATDSNAVPREGAGIASHWVIPDEDPWGLVRGMRFGEATDPYFRTAVHELGHAMGLYHNTVDNGFMHTTPDIAASAVPPQRFPQNIKWAHAADDQHRLRHMPDVWVRPGGMPFGSDYGTAPISTDDEMAEAEGLRVEVVPVLASVPLGAPVRVEVSLVNGTGQTLAVPASLALKDGNVRGRIVQPSGAVRTFRSLLRCIEEHRLVSLDDGEARRDSLTLLRGPEGALFPASGAYRVEVDVEWEVGDVPVRVTGAADVLVTGAQDEQHAAHALQLLSTPDALLTLALGGDHLTDGIAAVQSALADPVLRPHFAWIESKRVAQPFMDRPADLDRAAALIDEETVMSSAEVRKASRIADAAGGGAPERLAMAVRRRMVDG
jgi:hypothetical protein